LLFRFSQRTAKSNWRIFSNFSVLNSFKRSQRYQLILIEQLRSRLEEIRNGSSLVISPSVDYLDLVSFFYGVESGFAFTEEAKISMTRYSDTVMKKYSNAGWKDIVLTDICGWVEAPPQDKHEVVYHKMFEVFFDYLRTNAASKTEREFSVPSFEGFKEWSTVAIPRAYYEGRRYLVCLEGLKIGYAPMAELSSIERWLPYLENGPLDNEIKTIALNECMDQLEASTPRRTKDVEFRKLP
jgi:hypothetical protein